MKAIEKREIREIRDVGLVPGVDQNLAIAPKKQGVNTIDELLQHFNENSLGDFERPWGRGVRRLVLYKAVMRVLAVFICFAVLFCMFPASALSRVIVDDTVVLKDQKVMLRAETRGKLFSKGGEVVEFFVDRGSIGKTLSGGDGVAFKAFIPAKTGLHQIRVRSDGDEDTGLLLSLKRGSSIVFVDIVGCLLEGPFSRKPKQGGKKVIKELHKRFPVVFLQRGFFSVKAIRAWLKENEFAQLPVVPWRRGAIFQEIAQKDLKVKAIIAGPKVIKSAKEHEPLAFSFEPVEDAEWVKDWEEISKKFK